MALLKPSLVLTLVFLGLGHGATVSAGYGSSSSSSVASVVSSGKSTATSGSVVSSIPISSTVSAIQASTKTTSTSTASPSAECQALGRTYTAANGNAYTITCGELAAYTSSQLITSYTNISYKACIDACSTTLGCLYADFDDLHECFLANGSFEYKTYYRYNVASLIRPSSSLRAPSLVASTGKPASILSTLSTILTSKGGPSSIISTTKLVSGLSTSLSTKGGSLPVSSSPKPVSIQSTSSATKGGSSPVGYSTRPVSVLSISTSKGGASSIPTSTKAPGSVVSSIRGTSTFTTSPYPTPTYQCERIGQTYTAANGDVFNITCEKFHPLDSNLIKYLTTTSETACLDACSTTPDCVIADFTDDPESAINCGLLNGPSTVIDLAHYGYGSIISGPSLSNSSKTSTIPSASSIPKTGSSSIISTGGPTKSIITSRSSPSIVSSIGSTKVTTKTSPASIRTTTKPPPPPPTSSTSLGAYFPGTSSTKPLSTSLKSSTSPKGYSSTPVPTKLASSILTSSASRPTRTPYTPSSPPSSIIPTVTSTPPRPTGCAALGSTYRAPNNDTYDITCGSYVDFSGTNNEQNLYRANSAQECINSCSTTPECTVADLLLLSDNTWLCALLTGGDTIVDGDGAPYGFARKRQT